MQLRRPDSNEPKDKKSFAKLRKKLVSAGLATFFLVTPFMANPQRAEAYNPNSHVTITSNSVLMLKNDKLVDVDKLYAYVNVDKLMRSSTYPDYDEIDGARFIRGSSRSHFYDPATDANFMGETTNTANTKFCEHMDKAVAAAVAGNRDLAGEELGRALHFFQDMNVPFHSGNIPNMESPTQNKLTHTFYETWVDSNIYKYVQKSAPQSEYDSALNSSYWDIGKKAASNSKQYLRFVKSWYYAADPGNDRYATQYTLPQAQIWSAAILDKFVKQVEQAKQTSQTSQNQ